MARYPDARSRCETCNRTFVDFCAAAQHMDAKNHWTSRYECQSCDKDFLDNDDCIDHMDHFGHWTPWHKCHSCDYGSSNEAQCVSHMNHFGHWEKTFQCEACDHKFQSAFEARRHMDSRHHWRKYWCGECQKGFQNANNLQQHLHGSAHLAKSITCPFCKKAHTTASGVVHHIERGCCPRARDLSRETIYQFINRNDPFGTITNKQLGSEVDTNGGYIATRASFNGQQYECYLCHRGYDSLFLLNQHLSSPVHKLDIYHCISRSCSKQFRALAHLINHLESESCGAMKFAAVQQQARDMLRGRRIIGS